MCLTVAWENESTAFMQMVGYTGLVYAFALDIFVFEQIFSVKEIVCITIVITLMVALMVIKLRT